LHFTQGEEREICVTVSYSKTLPFIAVDWHWQYGV